MNTTKFKKENTSEEKFEMVTAQAFTDNQISILDKTIKFGKEQFKKVCKMFK
ncbi:unnamed protein product (macronuclear) [Paramecium tetraurelia]|uniref:Uncharacterized protein n=1 Tax=Paramecium tetraurelia TaxID=5888 RepID=A0DSP4_PARTE|nr:uncharacterized protein GSPATT00019754001 [Paramecium tetraurelia]CAK86061.1 unnamed protein product [Paramecium tetraurelia]|eukprot:XP_001453458.1 hypothetical protein (macronuclear) [Paramecium tetraurelia strain d4-2]